MADPVCTRTPAQSPYTIFDQWADEGAAARAAQPLSQATSCIAGSSAAEPADLSPKNGEKSPVGQPLLHHEQTVADTIAALLQQLRHPNGDDFINTVHPHAATLLDMALAALADGGDCTAQMFADVAALIAGASAIQDHLTEWDGPCRDALHQARELASSTADSYGFALEGAEAQAAGIEAGRLAQSLRQAPTRTAEGSANAMVFLTIAQQAEELRDLLSDVRTGAIQPMQTARNLFFAEQVAILIGAQADLMAGSLHIGNVASWATGDGIEVAA